MPRITKSDGQGIARLWFRTPDRKRRREWSRHFTIAERQATAQEVHVGTAGDVVMPPSGIGSRWKQEHRRPSSAGLGLEPRLTHPTTKLAPVGRVGEHAAVPGK